MRETAVMPTIHSQLPFQHWRIAPQRPDRDEIIQHSSFNRAIHQHGLWMEIVVSTEHKLAVGLNLNVDNAPVPVECHLDTVEVRSSSLLVPTIKSISYSDNHGLAAQI